MGGIPLQIRRNQFNAKIDKRVWQPKYGRNDLTARLRADACEVCGSRNNIEVHHIKSIKQLKKQTGKKDLPIWVIQMSKRYRNTIVVCRNCHQSIHNGTYDGKKLH